MEEGRKYFTEHEAVRMLHRRVRSLLKLPAVPKGSVGTITLTDCEGDGYILGVEWDFPGSEGAIVGWFSREEFEELLAEC